MPPQLHKSDDSAATGEVQEGDERGAPATGERAGLSLPPKELAQAHGTATRTRSGRTRRAFMKRLQEHEALLHEAYEHFVRVSQEEPVLSYAAEWFLDNYYLLQRVNNQTNDDFSDRYYRELPKLPSADLPHADLRLASHMDGYPRVFDIARHLVAQAACEVDERRIRRFLDEYQDVNPLRIGELWALPIMLRIVLLEYVIQAAGTTMDDGQRSAVGGLPPVADLGDEDLIATCIPSLRALAHLDWKTFVESVSHVDRVLNQDPAQVYSQMDFDTRDRYRKSVEVLALESNREEVAVAQAAAHLARENGHQAADGGRRSTVGGRQTHVGYYLIDRGRPQLEEQIGYQPPAGARLKEALKAHPTFIYLGSISVGVLALLLVAATYLISLESSLPLMAFTLALLIVPAVTVVTSVVNWLVTRVVPPRVLPKLDFSDGIPHQHRTFVVIPSMLSDQEEVQSLLKQLEGHFLRNPDPNLCFALLTDFTDTQEEETPGGSSEELLSEADRRLLDAAREGIEALNRAHSQAPFYLFHRRRLWNERENVWMGWERKRGKLHEFNRLLRANADLRSAQDTSFDVQFGDLSRLEGVQYVITLDTDTILPRDGAATLVGAMAHPLNRVQFDPQTGNVTAGYTILQPRTQIQPDWGRQSLFIRVFAGDSGLDLYSQAVSNVYHDLFGEGIYVGKGIYDVDAFERSLKGRVPENSLLSHDLFEGIHGRAGLISDVIFYEDYPSHYLLQVRRTHRWVRGDWQLLPWLLPSVPTTSGWQRNPLALIDLWKIADNLRRSLLSPLLLLLLIAGWTILPGPPVLWTLVAVLTPALALMTGVISALLQFAAGNRAAIKRQLRDSLVRWMLYIAFLPYEATLNADAIITTLVRLVVTRRNLLQWTTASHTSRLFGDEVSADLAWQNMISSFLVSAILGIALFLINPQVLPVALPLLLLWSLSPELAYVISRPEKPQISEVGDEQKARLRRLARRTWFFFERFVGPDDNWLPPDHFQEDPKGIVAHRTSPTNIGLYLLSAIAAHDLGYIDPMALMLRLRSAFDAMQHLERYRGHFLNWNDTSTLAPLSPRYVSTVDSGNLAGCLIALQQALIELPQKPALRWTRWQGLLDTLDLFVEALSDGAPPQDVEAFKSYLTALEEQIYAAREMPRKWSQLLDEAAQAWLPEMERRLITIVEQARGSIGPDKLHDWRLFIERAADHVQNMKREQELLAPWLAALSQPPALFARGDLAPEIRRAWEAVPMALDVGPTARGKTSDSLEQSDVSSLPTLRGVASIAAAGRRTLEELRSLLSSAPALDDPGAKSDVEEALAWVETLDERLESGRWMAQSIVAGCVDMKQQAETIVQQMDFEFLFHRQRQVFHIGYNLDAGRLDDNYYDMLASEARIASLVAIAKNDVPFSHWLHLARPVTSVQGRRTLLSWSGTMFEYLMPPLLLRSYNPALLNSSARHAIEHQIAYAAEHDLPWGISESGFYTFDAAMNYQYRAFGVPGLGFKRGLSEDMVVTPYASLLALPFTPHAVLANLDRLDALGMKGRYGYFEAVDFTESRLSLGQRAAIVYSYMSHHQGMILLALANFLNDGKMIDRFHADARIQSVEMLLQEQIPYGAPLETPQADETVMPAPERVRVPTHAWRVPTQTPMPAVHYLSNGPYNVMLTNSGGGYSRWNDIALTRWRPDMTLDNWGQWLYIEDRESGALWSAALQPVGTPVADGSQPVADGIELSFYPHKVQWRRRDHDITLHAEVFVAPDDDVEIRRYRLTNDSDRRRRLRLTSYAEVALTEQATDQRHQAFAKLFVESKYLAQYDALQFRRRPRAHDEEAVYLAHMVVAEGDDGAKGTHPISSRNRMSKKNFETDRLRFLGRNGSLNRPQALENGRWLSVSEAAAVSEATATLDPIASLGRTVTVEPYSTVELAFITVAAASRKQVERLLERYQSWSMLDRAAELSRSRADHKLQRLELGSPALELGQQLLSLLLYPHPARRADANALSANRKGQSALWAYGISGDYPILLLILHDESESELLQELLRIHGYWYSRGLEIDLVVLNDQYSNYGQMLQGFISRSVRRAGAADRLQRRGGIFIVSRDQIGEEEYQLLQAAARVCLDGAYGTLRQQLDGIYEQPTRLPVLEPTADLTGFQKPVRSTADSPPSLADPRSAVRDRLLFHNGFGGFSPGGDGEPAGKEYVIHLQPGQTTPAPWINVIANPDFGFVISESGGGFTWSQNSGENRLTTWRNDPVADRPAEAIYLRDEETAEVWSPTPQPAPAREATTPYLIRHGAGYTVFQHESHGLEQELSLFVALDASVKIVRLRLKNLAPRQRRLTATYYAEWVLGSARATTQQYLIPEYVGDCNALLVRNPYNVEFGERVAFLATSREPHGVTADRAEFLGRLGSLQRPAALQRIGLENAVNAGLDVCGAMQLHVDLAPEETETVYFLLGQGDDRQHALQLLGRFQSADEVDAAWQRVHDHWDRLLGAVQVDTPDEAMNLMLNRWLLYQALSCRIWGRSALYQSSGAYGFRDQLQDVMSLMHSCPKIARQHILRAARHQFEEGDVLHWWHPPSGRGVRTRISDDLLWLPFVTAHYVNTTGDAAILDEKLPFLKGKLLSQGEEERYGHYASTTESFTLFEHCVRALYKGMTQGRHGLPLIGAGDWNDGMNRVGIEGEGESVWLGWFLCDTLRRFAALCEQLGKDEYAASFRERAAEYQQALESAGWDGQWYRRAYYDDGSPLGSRQNTECQIDAIAQSWSVLSVSEGQFPETAIKPTAGARQRREQAMTAVEQRLIDHENRLLLLFTPPFDETDKDPGYIKGYPPGIRENGGQYTHAAIWTAWAFARLRQDEKAEALFRLLNPVYHAATHEAALNYRVEPYVIAADVYGVPPHMGRGGWTWYTGSSGWMYRLGLEAILGLQREGPTLRIEPAIPPQWPAYRLTYRFGTATYHIEVINSGEQRDRTPVTLDGERLADERIPLRDDGRQHQVQVRLPLRESSAPEQEKEEEADDS